MAKLLGRYQVPPIAEKRWMGHPRRLWLNEGERFALRTNAHLSDDEAVAKMGHPQGRYR